MTTYKDRTWCVSSAPANRKCHNEKCMRYLRDKDQNDAREKQMPVAWGDFHNRSYGLKCPYFVGVDAV